MATTAESTEIKVPTLPAKHDDFIKYTATHPKTSLLKLLEPYKQYDAELRKAFAQQPDHPALQEPNITPVFTGHEQDVKIRARDLHAESQTEKDFYIMPLKAEDRKADGSPAIVPSLREFKTNFNVFSESSLADLDWSNVVVAGSAVVTALLAVPEEHAQSKRALRRYYHEQLAPASDVDLFLYGLTEEEAVEKIEQIEGNVRDALLVETTTVRTKNTVTIASHHPVRHVQIVLRIYSSISEILTGFDVDCSCAAYDGSQVYASPRTLVAIMTQINTIDLTRRSPSYEMRLSKYAHRGFEVYWPMLDRSRVDPTIFERSFGRTEGLARLLILEKLPKSEDREAYLDQRRAERGRPPVNRWRMRRRVVYGDIKNDYEDEVAEWVDEEASDYHTVTIPYGPKYPARKIEKLLYTKDLLLNSEWNKPKDREVNLHRHPAFFGSVDDVVVDCCQFCPVPATIEEEEVAEKENKTFVSGAISFMNHNAGRQEIGSFNPITGTEWTAMAYVSNTEQLCQAIVDHDLHYVESWLSQGGNDPLTRDHTGRCALHLAVSHSTIEIVQALIDHGARMIARLVDGKTALHLAAMRGNVEMVSALLRRSEANEEDEEKKVDARRAARNLAKKENGDNGISGGEPVKDVEPAESGASDDSDVDMMNDADDDEIVDATTEHSMVNIKGLNIGSPDGDYGDRALASDDNNDEDPDIYDVNVVAWDTAASPLHLAIAKGHTDVVKCLVEDFGADILLPIKIHDERDRSAKAAILTLVLALQLPMEKAEEMVRTLIQLGASSAQADFDSTTSVQYCVADRPDQVETLIDADATGFKRAINHLSTTGNSWNIRVSSPLMTAIKAKDSDTALRLLIAGAKPEIDFTEYMRAYATKNDPPKDSKHNRRNFEQNQDQPIISAVKAELPLFAKNLVEDERVDVNTLTTEGYQVLNNDHSRRYTKGRSLLDLVHKKLKALRNWEHKRNEPKPPTPLKEDEEYLSDFEEGTYAMWSAQKQVEAQKQHYKRELKDYKEKLERSKDVTGVPEMQEAVNSMIADFEQLEAALVEKGAKKFKDLHPEIEKPEKREPYSYHRRPSHEPKPFDVELRFQLGDLSEQSQSRYENLFEAAWNGEVEEVKTLTLKPWKDENDEDQPPSQVSARDQFNMSPLSIAVVRGHQELASATMSIAQVQYVHASDEAKTRRYELDTGDQDSDFSDEEANDEPQLFSEIVDDEFTIETIGEVSLQVKSRHGPIDMLQWSCPVADFADLRSKSQDGAGQTDSKGGKSTTMAGKRTNTGSLKLPSPPTGVPHKELTKPNNLIQHAIYTNDLKTLEYLLGLAEQYFRSKAETDDEIGQRVYSLPGGDLNYAIEAGHAHLIAEVIKRTGAGLPLDHLAKQYGGDIKEKPRYYQGLSVHGRKRKDWADAGRGIYGHQSVQKGRPPLLDSAYKGSLELVEWFLSDAPLRVYQEFFEGHKGFDKRLQKLALSKDGFEGVVEKFLGTRSHLAIHLCIMAEPTVESDKLLRYLVETMPAWIETKTTNNQKPLQVAFELYREDAAKLLIAASADQTCRDVDSENLIHSLLSRSFTEEKHVTKFKRMVDLIDQRLLSTMFSERTSGESLTPLAYFIERHGSERDEHVQVLRLILEYSGGRELSLISGSGDTPLHWSVKTKNVAVTRVILDHDMTLMNRENSVGVTPYQLAEDAAIADLCSDPPPMPHHHSFKARKARRYGLSVDSFNDILSRSPKSFVEEAKAWKNDREQVWDMLQDAKAKLDALGTSKRRIVTLNEANEVARRLAAEKSSSRRGRRNRYSVVEGDNSDDSGDEVSTYMHSAKRS